MVLPTSWYMVLPGWMLARAPARQSKAQRTSFCPASSTCPTRNVCPPARPNKQTTKQRENEVRQGVDQSKAKQSKGGASFTPKPKLTPKPK